MRPFTMNHCCRKVLCSIICLGAHHGVALATTWLPIAWTEEVAVGVPGEPLAQHFIMDAPALNNSGQVAFRSFLSATSISNSNNNTIWSGPANNPQLVVREGDSAPGTMEVFEHFDPDPLLNNAGQVLINANVTGPFDQSNGLWVGSTGSLQFVARVNTPLPGLTHQIDSIEPSSAVLSDNGKVAFLGVASNDKTAMWYGSPGSLTVVAMEGSNIPAGSGLPSDVKFESLAAPTESPVINSSGKIAFQATIADDDFDIFGRSIWTGVPGSLQLLAREETPAPGVPGEEYFLLNTLPVMNNAGQVAFGAELSNFHDSIWLGTPGNLHLLVEGNDPAPVGTAGVRFAEFGTYKELRLSDSGHVAFEGWLDGTGVNSSNELGLFRAAEDEIDMVARLGSQAPGMQPGTVFEFFDSFSINPSGQMAFVAETTGGGVGPSNSLGIWAENADDQLQLVAREGDWVNPVTGGVVRLVDASDPDLLRSQGYDQIFQLHIRSAFKLNPEFGTAWNSQHQIALEVVFADTENGSALFLADLGSLDGDFDNDGDVDGRDFLVWQRTDGTPGGLAAWRDNYGQGGSLQVWRVPEPCSALISLIAISMMGAASRRHLVR